MVLQRRLPPRSLPWKSPEARGIPVTTAGSAASFAMALPRAYARAQEPGYEAQSIDAALDLVRDDSHVILTA